MTVATWSRRLTDLLHLVDPPVALARLTAPPPGARILTSAPSGCTIWRMGEGETLYAPVAAHLTCPLGAHVLGMPLDTTAGAELGRTIESMLAVGYLRAGEPQSLPTMPAQADGGVLYGPLATFPVPPELVIAWVDARGAMLMAEATDALRWDEARGARPAGLPVTGRPGCAALPIAYHERRPALSFGCTGMRTFTSISDGSLLAVLPGVDLDGWLDALTSSSAAQSAMAARYAVVVSSTAREAVQVR